MKYIAGALQSLGRMILFSVMLAVLVVASSVGAGLQPSYAANLDEGAEVAAEEPVERAYNVFGSQTGTQEEVYQQRLREGQDPEKMPGTYKRVPSFADASKEVPETSPLETTISRIREKVDELTQD